jgi:GNAT superfamily N-acetyltransferase
MNIRRAQSGDVDKLLPLASDLATSFVVDPAAFRESFHECLQDENSVVLVAEHESSLVGYLLGFDHVAFFANGRVSGVEELYVIPQQRRRGIGRALMREFERWARSRSSAQIVVCTRRAAEFYVALGYEETATCFRNVLKHKAQS